MTIAGINVIAVLAATIAGMAIGALWYSPLLLAQPWMRAIGKRPEDIMPTPRPFIVAGLSNLVMATMLAGLMFHVGGAQIRTGVISALLVWLGFVATTIAVNHQFQGMPFALTLIDAGHWLAVLVLMAVVIGAFGT